MSEEIRLGLNTLSPSPGSRRPRRRVGRGTGSGFGKTAGRGHKGQRSRAGEGRRPRFEGGQTPLHRRIPKFGFHSRVGRFVAQLRLDALNKVQEETIDLSVLKSAGLVRRDMKRARVFLAGTLERAVHLQGIAVTKGARAAIEAAGGTVKDPAQKHSETANGTEKEAGQ